ncbi:MAG: chlorophyll synthesis pathway protein BchC [Pseudomonadota bacterium]
METSAVIFAGERSMSVDSVALSEPEKNDLVVDIRYSGVSTGTEKLLWDSSMPVFPGMGYPLIPGYEAVGEVVEAGRQSGFKLGDTVFVPGARCYREVRGLFGGAAAQIVTPHDRVVKLDAGLGAEAALLALAATARHALAGPGRTMPDLIVGHGVLGRLLARLTIAAGAAPPTVWEIDPHRRTGAQGYSVLAPDADTRTDYTCIYDASGAAGLLDRLMLRLARGGEIVLAGFYAQPVSFAFPPAFMREARLRVASEWTRDDLLATRALIEAGALSLAGLITHRCAARKAAAAAYDTAFGDPACLKMILDWEDAA